MFLPFHFSLQQLPTVSFSSFSSSPSSFHISHNSSFLSLFTKASFSSFFYSHPDSRILSNSLILSFSLFIFYNGTLGQEVLQRPFFWCIPPHPLEWGNKVDRISIVDIPARESHPYGWICKFFKLFSFSIFFLIFCFNLFLAMWMLGYCCGVGLDENLTS